MLYKYIYYIYYTILYSVRSLVLTLYRFPSLYIFVTWRWPTVAETCRQHNKTYTKTVVFWRTYPLQICIKHKGDDASKDYKTALSQDLITQEVTTNRGVEIRIHAFVNSALQRRKRAASDFRSFPSVHPQTRMQAQPQHTVVTTQYSRS